MCAALRSSHLNRRSLCVSLTFSHAFLFSCTLWPNISVGTISCGLIAIQFFFSCMLHCVIHEVQHTYWKNYFVKLEKNNLILLWMFQVVKKRKPLARHIQWICVSLAIVFLWRHRVAPLRVCGRSMSAISSRAERNAWLLSAINLNVCNLAC